MSEDARPTATRIDEPASRNTTKPERPAEVDADDERLAADPVGQPAGDQRHRHREHDERAVHQARRRSVEADDERQVDQREQVDDAEPAAAAAQDRGQVQPAQVAVAQDPSERGADGAAGPGGGPVRAALPDEHQDRDRDGDRRHPEDDRRAAPADQRR